MKSNFHSAPFQIFTNKTNLSKQTFFYVTNHFTLSIISRTIYSFNAKCRFLFTEISSDLRWLPYSNMQDNQVTIGRLCAAFEYIRHHDISGHVYFTARSWQQKAISLSFAKIVADSGIFEKGTFVPSFYDVHSFSTRVAVALKNLPRRPRVLLIPGEGPPWERFPHIYTLLSKLQIFGLVAAIYDYRVPRTRRDFLISALFKAPFKSCPFLRHILFRTLLTFLIFIKV